MSVVHTVPVTPTMDLRKMLATNSTDTAFDSIIPKTTEPSGDGLIKTSEGGGGVMPNAIKVLFYGTGDDNDTFSARVIGWHKIGVGTGAGRLWVPIILAELACTMSATVGIANAPVVATERFVDTITLVTGNDDISIDIVSPTGDEIAHAVLDLKGCQYIEFSFDTTAGDPTGCGGLFAYL